MLISPMDGSLRLVESTSPVWHIDAVRGPSTPSLRGAKRRSNPDFAWRDGLLRGACHRTALRADPLARNDEGANHSPSKSSACGGARGENSQPAGFKSTHVLPSRPSTPRTPTRLP